MSKSDEILSLICEVMISHIRNPKIVEQYTKRLDKINGQNKAKASK